MSAAAAPKPRGRPRTRSYSPEAERLLAELATDVRAGKLRSTSSEYHRRWRRASRGLPGAGTPRRLSREIDYDGAPAPRDGTPRRLSREIDYDGAPAPRDGTLIEQAARAIQRVRPCTFTEAVVAALGWRGIATV